MQIGQKIDEIGACACLAFITGVNNKAGGELECVPVRTDYNGYISKRPRMSSLCRILCN